MYRHSARGVAPTDTTNQKYAPFPALLYVMDNCSRTLTYLDAKFDAELNALIGSLQDIKKRSNEKHQDYEYATTLIDKITNIIQDIDTSVVKEQCYSRAQQIENLVDEVKTKILPPPASLQEIKEIANSLNYIKESDQPFMHLYKELNKWVDYYNQKLTEENERLKKALAEKTNSII
jgi:hypothetical protein